MRIILACFLTLFSFSASSQKRLVCRNYEYALKNASSVTEIDVNCMHGDFYGSESCGDIPENIGDCKNLQRFRTSEAYYTTLPQSFAKLKRLKSLDIEYNIGFNYKKELCKLVVLDSLEHLGFGMNHIYRFPDCITKMKSLRSLDLSCSDTIDLRHTFNLLSNIPTFEKLDISNLIFVNVPGEISSLRKLKSLSVERNDWLNCDTLVDNISQLPINDLNMIKCGLAQLPRRFIRLQQLRTLHIDQNNLRRLPKELYELPDLEELSIGANKIREIPEDVARLRKLKKLDISGNEFVDAASSVHRLATIEMLEDLAISNCNIQLVAEAFSQFGRLKKLEVKDLPDEHLRDLFRQLANVNTLTYLDLSQVRGWDRVVDEKPLPAEIGLLTNLEYLILDENGNIHLRLPQEFFNLTKLKELHLAYVKLDKSQEDEIRKRLPNCKIVYEQGREE